MYDNFGASGELHAKAIRLGMNHVGDGLYEHHGLLGDLSRFSDDATDLGRVLWGTALHALHLDGDGNVKGQHHLGPGLTTNVGALALANDPFLAAPSGAPISTLKLANQHATGTGSTAAAATDIALQTSAGPSPVAGTQSLVSAANLQILKSVATLAYGSGLAITEWGLFTDATLSASTGTPFTATSATGGTVTATPLTASSATVQGQQQHIVKAGTTPAWGLITSNTTGALVIPAWYKTADGTASATPGGTEAYTILPVMWDHKVFSALNVVSGDSIQFSYSLTIQSGG